MNNLVFASHGYPEKRRQRKMLVTAGLESLNVHSILQLIQVDEAQAE